MLRPGGREAARSGQERRGAPRAPLWRCVSSGGQRPRKDRRRSRRADGPCPSSIEPMASVPSTPASTLPCRPHAHTPIRVRSSPHMGHGRNGRCRAVTALSALQPVGRTMASDVNHRHHRGDSHGTGHSPSAPRSRPEEPLQGRSCSARRRPGRNRRARRDGRDPRERRRREGRGHASASRPSRSTTAASTPRPASPAPGDAAARHPLRRRPRRGHPRHPGRRAAPGTRFDGGPDEGTRGPQTNAQSASPLSSYQAPDEDSSERATQPVIPMGPGGR